MVSMWCLFLVRIDFGWNWILWIGSLVCCMVMIILLLVWVVIFSIVGSDLGRIVNEWY